MFEFSRYFSKIIKNEMLVDLSPSSNKLKISLDISLYNYPCALVCLDTSDGIGSHTFNLEEGLSKISINQKGEEIPNKKLTSTKSLSNDQIYNLALEQYKNNEGCRVKGHFEVLRIPGNFHISAHGFRDAISKLKNNKDIKFSFNFTHKINHLSFGDEVAINDIHNEFKVGIFNPLDGSQKIDNKKDNIFQYYLHIIPSQFEKENKKLDLFQYVVNEHVDDDYGNFPAIFFRLNISPILVKYSLITPNTFNAIVNICAIFGGLFTIAELLDSFLLGLFSKKNTVAQK